jgi:hypothetical protein
MGTGSVTCILTGNYCKVCCPYDLVFMVRRQLETDHFNMVVSSLQRSDQANKEGKYQKIHFSLVYNAFLATLM